MSAWGAHSGDRQPLVLNALDGCWLEGAVSNIRAQHQVGVGGDDPLLHSASNASAHSRNTKGLINDELSVVLDLVMPAVKCFCSANMLGAR